MIQQQRDMVRRLYVEKKKGFDVEAQSLKKELAENLGIAGIGDIRVVNRYDVAGISDTLFEKAKKLVFSEINLDDIIGDEIIIPDGAFAFGTEYLPGQFDQRADSAETCIRLIEEGAEPIVRCAKIIVIEGLTDSEAKRKIIKYCVNPVDSREASFEKPDTLEIIVPEPKSVAVCEGFRAMDSGELSAFRASMGFAMSEEDLSFVQAYFKNEENREPTYTELRVIDTYWSDHCRHTTFLTSLTDISFEEDGISSLIKDAYGEYLRLRKEVYGDEKAKSRPVTLMDMATIGAKYLKSKGLAPDIDESEEINACSIKVKAEILRVPEEHNGDGSFCVPEIVTEDWLVMFKNETHNHPTEIEPFGGAATCLGGGIRDPLSGRAYVYQAMRVTGSGDPGIPIEETPPGKLTQYQITRGAAKGYSSYGNQVGVATGLVDEIYDNSYIAKRMEIGAIVGAAPAENVVRERPEPGDAILAVGGRTGRDGIGGATGSSKEHTEESVQAAGAEVQKGNPPIERDIQRLFRRHEAARLIKRCNDFGAGGVSVAIGELAPGIDVDLDKVPKKYEGLDGTELAISESQERMAVVIAADKVAEFSAYADEENVEVTQVARVTDTGRFRMHWRGDRILDLSRDFLDTNGVQQERQVKVRENNAREASTEQSLRLVGGEKDKSTRDCRLLASLSDLNCASKRGLIEHFDSTIGAGTLLLPLGGKRQITPAVGMAAKLPVLNGETNTATLMSYGFDPELARLSPFHSAIYAVLDSCAKICAMGGDAEKIRLSFQEYFPKLGSDPERWGLPFMALLGALKAQIELGVPSIGGKDSMSGSFENLDVVPTLVSFAVCAADARHILSPELKKAGSRLVLLECPRDKEKLPDFTAFKNNMKRVHALAGKGKILSANTVSHGGLFAAVSKMALGNWIGATLSATNLTVENYGSLLLEISGTEDPDILFNGLNYSVVGNTTDSGTVEANGEVYTLKEIEERWESPLAPTFPVEVDATPAPASTLHFLADLSFSPPASRQELSTRTKIPKPRVFIPVFPGTNCEEDSRHAFERAGAEVCIVNLLTKNEEAMRGSIRRMAEEIHKSQIVMIPGGFSGGDEPEGSAKFITAVFRNPYMTEAVHDLLDNRGGLMLGICNGFQALVKLGLLPYGRITEPNKDAPTLTYNTIGRHMSRLVRSRVCSTLSPWLAAAEPGDIHTLPVSNGEGRFVANEKSLKTLADAGQIATQYVDLAGEPTYDIRFNPNGSAIAIEGITSPDGRIFGRMGHAERNAPGLYVNVPGNFDNSIFKSGIDYFR